jgi:hypothetical protein
LQLKLLTTNQIYIQQNLLIRDGQSLLHQTLHQNNNFSLKRPEKSNEYRKKSRLRRDKTLDCTEAAKALQVVKAGCSCHCCLPDRRRSASKRCRGERLRPAAEAAETQRHLLTLPVEYLCKTLYKSQGIPTVLGFLAYICQLHAPEFLKTACCRYQVYLHSTMTKEQNETAENTVPCIRQYRKTEVTFKVVERVSTPLRII